MELIDKSALVAEIERRKTKNQKDCTAEGSGAYYEDGFILDIINSIRTIEVKEVDLKKEVDDYYNTIGIPINVDALKETARYFFELGLIARKENKI